MKTTFRKFFTAITLLLVIGLSAFVTVPAYADETSPEETVEVTEQTSPTEEAPPSERESASEPESSDSAETVASILESILADTQLIVLDEEGEALPLATEEAEQAVIVGDPIWCPASVATPVDGGSGCSPSYETFSDLLVWLAANDPGVAGTIWIHKEYNSSTAFSDIGGVDDVGVTSFTLNGLTLTNMAGFALTIKGGWNGIGTNTVDTANPSEFAGANLTILNWNAPVTISDVTVTGNSTGTYSLRVTTTGNIAVTRVNVSNNPGGGASFENNVGASTANVAVSDSTFNNNTNSTSGLRILSNGIVTIKNATANGNGVGAGGMGIEVNNQSATTAKAVTVSNITVSGNRNSGLFVQSNGAITVTDITAVGNGQGVFSNGVALRNYLNGYTSPVTMNGTNLIFSNIGYGLNIESNGAVKLNSIHAVNNTYIGAYIKNNIAATATPQPVTLTGTSAFKFNGFNGLNIISLGTVTLNNITANSNTNRGVFVDNDEAGANGDVKLTGTNFFNNNTDTGLFIVSTGAIMLNNVTANDNFVYGVYLNNTASTAFKAVTLSGVNQFTGNNTSHGLHVLSDGIVTLNNITSNGNGGGYGVYVNNTTSMPAKPMAVNIAGTINMFNNNKGTGLGIYSHGAVTLNNITANFNGIVNNFGYGLDINNSNSTITPANVTLNGINTFNGNYSTGVSIFSLGAIKANSLTVKDNLNDNGAILQNNFGVATAGITLTGTNIFTGNKGANLAIYSFGVVSLNNITASNSVSNQGLLIYNAGAVTSKDVTLTGTNVFNGNWVHGLNINSIGAITLNNITANNNGTSGTGGYGAYLVNSSSNAGVTLNGTNAFNGNYQTGLYISTLGNIKLNNITANNSINTNQYGAFLSNASGTGSVTLTGTNTFSGNKGTNLYVDSAGIITINNLTANNSVDSQGAYIDNRASGAISPKAVMLTGNNTFNGNDAEGLEIYSYGAITTNNLIANGNGIGSNDNGVKLENLGGSIAMPIKMNGTNTFMGNYGLNLAVYSLGAITANNVTANNSVNHYGATLQNYLADVAVNITLTGTNSFSENNDGGLTIYTKGAITISNVTANNNLGGGLGAILLDNTYTTPTVTNKPITILGYSITNDNTFASGLYIQTFSTVTLNNVTANNNSSNGLEIRAGFGYITPFNVTLNGVNQANGNTNTGTYITTLGNITINNLIASENNYKGLYINAMGVNATGNITLKGTNVFNRNSNIGVEIYTHGAVLANNVTVKNTVSASGMVIFSGGGMPQPVTLTGINTFSNNSGDGLNIIADGVVTLSNVTANTNTDNGAIVIGAGNVTLTGKNQFNNNTLSGLDVFTLGNITISNLTAHNNGFRGVNLENDMGPATNKITITGINSFVNNTNTGLRIITSGSVTLTKITADKNSGSGAQITADNVTLTCGSFVNNTVYGLSLNAQNATLTGIVAAGNTTGNFDFTIPGTLTQKHGCPLP